uniref:Uncharacterized protein n=1 Tax=Arundo donax TaxID=35708 RepID=A0A0A9DBE0_ARUDO
MQEQVKEMTRQFRKQNMKVIKLTERGMGIMILLAIFLLSSTTIIMEVAMTWGHSLRSAECGTPSLDLEEAVYLGTGFNHPLQLMRYGHRI